VNKTLSQGRLPHLEFGSKPKLKALDVSKIDFDNDAEALMPKYDGAHNYLDLGKVGKIPRMYSYRTPKKHTSGVIEHTHKVQTLLQTRVPKELQNTTLRVETLAVDKDTGKALPARTLAGMLNAGVENSRKAQQEANATLLPVAFDVIRYKGKDVTNLPYRARYELLNTVKSQINIPITEIATSAKDKSKLLAKIRGGRHPVTSEGVVLRPLDVSSKTPQATKAKFRPDHDVYVREIFPAVGQKGEALNRAGGFRYSWSPRGPIVGSIGTGFDHGTARDMLEHPERYKGRVAKVEAETKYPSGALGKGAFKEWHLEKGNV
jgi:ATP-dependent DNA ligase